MPELIFNIENQQCYRASMGNRSVLMNKLQMERLKKTYTNDGVQSLILRLIKTDGKELPSVPNHRKEG